MRDPIGASRSRRRLALSVAVLALASLLGGCVVYPAYGPPPGGVYFRGGGGWDGWHHDRDHDRDRDWR